MLLASFNENISAGFGRIWGMTDYVKELLI